MAMPASDRVRIRVEDFEVDPENPCGRELLDGEVVVRGAPALKHATVVARLLRRLGHHSEVGDLGMVWTSPCGVVFGDGTYVLPDVFFVSKDRLGIVTEDDVRGAPDLIVEVLSPGTRGTDMVRKRDLYDRFGVPEYWLVDPDAGSVTVLRRDDSGRLAFFHELACATGGGILATPLLPGFALEIAELFA